MAAKKDLNRLKVILAEKKSPVFGYLNNWDVRQQQYQNGVPIHCNLICNFR